MQTPLRAHWQILLCVGSLATGACGAPRAADRARSDEAAQATTASATSDPHVIIIVATDFSFDAPAQISAGITKVHLVDQGHELHHVQLIRLADGKTAADLAAALKQPGPPPSWVSFASGPNAPVPGGGTSDATVMLEPGNYVMVCAIPSADQVPHMAKGMVKPLVVVANTDAPGSVLAEPTSDVTLALNEYGFVVAPSIAAGAHTFRVDNHGVQPHEVLLVRMAPGKKALDLTAWVEKQVGPPPAEPLGGLTGLSSGSHAYFTADLPPGRYAFLCFLPDTKDGRPHVAHGMIKDFTVGPPAAAT